MQSDENYKKRKFNLWILEHSGNQVIDVFFSVTVVTTLDEVILHGVETSLWSVQFEGPEEVVDFSEFWTNCLDLVNKVFNTDDVVFSELFFNLSVADDWDSLFVDLGKTSLVDQVSNGFHRWISPSNVWFSNSEQVQSSLVQSNENSVVNLSQSQQLQNFSNFWNSFFHTTNSDDKSKLCFWFDEEVSVGHGSLSQFFKVSLLSLVFLSIFLSSLGNQGSLGFSFLYNRKSIVSTSSKEKYNYFHFKICHTINKNIWVYRIIKMQ